jgi:hypothetical protein
MIAFNQFFTEQVRDGKTAVFAYGRFNPPSIGHLKLVERVVNVAQNNNADYFIIPSQQSSVKRTLSDYQKNPLSLEDRVSLLKHMVNDPKTVVSFGTTFINALKELQKLGYTDIIQIAGSDREKDFTDLVNRYNGQPNKEGEIPFQFNTYSVVSSGQRDPDSEGVEGMSASKLRNLAAAGNYEKFKKGMASGVPEILKLKTYKQIRKVLGVE